LKRASRRWLQWHAIDALERAIPIALRARVEALRAVPCGMAHERMPDGLDGDPMRRARSPFRLCADRPLP
jgi:hypothetical protein